MKKYRELGPNEVVPKGAEVLVQDCDRGSNNFLLRYFAERKERKEACWYNNSLYEGLLVKNCYGGVTGRRRIFRVEIRGKK